MTKNIFLSFDDEDLDLVNLFRGQAKNINSDLEFKDYSIKESINSENAPYIKSQIKPQILSCSNLIVLFGKDTHTSDWVDWEIEVGLNEMKNVFGVVIDKENFQYVSTYFKNSNLPLLGWDHEIIMNHIK